MHLSWSEPTVRAVTSLSESLRHPGPLPLLAMPGTVSRPASRRTSRSRSSGFTPSLSARTRGCKRVHFCLPVCTRCSGLHGLYGVTPPLCLSSSALLTAWLLHKFTTGFGGVDTGGPQLKFWAPANLGEPSVCGFLHRSYHLFSHLVSPWSGGHRGATGLRKRSISPRPRNLAINCYGFVQGHRAAGGRNLSRETCQL